MSDSCDGPATDVQPEESPQSTATEPAPKNVEDPFEGSAQTENGDTDTAVAAESELASGLLSPAAGGDGDDREESDVGPAKSGASRRTKAFKKYKLPECERKALNARNFLCDICALSFRSEEDLDLHKIFHTKLEMNACDICGAQYMSKYSLSVHLLTHKNKATNFACPQCSKVCHNLIDLGRHLYVAHPQQPATKFSADKQAVVTLPTRPRDSYLQCKKGAQLTTKLRHNGKTIYRCTKCDKISGRLSRHISHIRTHTNEKPFKCKRCPLAFRLRGDCERHTTSVHEMGYTFICGLCHFGFLKESNYKAHFRNTHTNYRETFKCPHCPKTLGSSTGMAIHKRSHTGEKPYTCDVCDERFTNYDIKKRHMKSKHGQVGPPKKRAARKSARQPKVDDLELDPKFSQRLSVRVKRLDPKEHHLAMGPVLKGFSRKEIFETQQKAKRHALNIPKIIFEKCDSSENEDVEVVLPVPPSPKIETPGTSLPKLEQPVQRLHHLIPDIFADFCSSVFNPPRKPATIKVKSEPYLISDSDDDDAEDNQSLSNVHVSKSVHPDYVQFKFKVFYKNENQLN